MGGYVEVRGLRSWYDEAGDGEPLVLLHGGMCTNETWQAQFGQFAERFHVLAPERAATATRPTSRVRCTTRTWPTTRSPSSTPWSEVPPTWSAGATAASSACWSDPTSGPRAQAHRHRYELRHRRVGAGSRSDADGDGSGRRRRGDVPRVARLPFARRDRPLVDVPRQVRRHGESEPHIPVEDLGRISSPALVVVGDDDMVSLEHTIRCPGAIPDAELAVVPRTSHAVVMEKPALLNQLVLDFLEHDAAPTMLPMRRAELDHA